MVEVIEYVALGWVVSFVAFAMMAVSVYSGNSKVLFEDGTVDSIQDS